QSLCATASLEPTLYASSLPKGQGFRYRSTSADAPGGDGTNLQDKLCGFGATSVSHRRWLQPLLLYDTRGGPVWPPGSSLTPAPPCQRQLYSTPSNCHNAFQTISISGGPLMNNRTTDLYQDTFDYRAAYANGAHGNRNAQTHDIYREGSAIFAFLKG